MKEFTREIERGINDRIQAEIDARFAAEEKLQNELKWLKIELKESRVNERVSILENKLTVAYLIIIASVLINTI